MKIVLAILVSTLLGYFWVWLFQHIFAKQQKKFSRKLFGISFLIVLLLLAFNIIVKRLFPNVDLPKTQLGIISMDWWALFLLYCGLIFLFLIILTKNRNKKQIWFLFFIRMILFAVTGFLGLILGISVYYFVLAYAEEFLKIGATENEVGKTDFYSSDLLFFSIFIALGFSIFENFMYLGNVIFSPNPEGIRGLIFGRGIFTSLLHFIATGLIALVLYKLYQQKNLKDLKIGQKICRITIAILIGVLIHRGYNVSISHMNLLIYIILIFGGYFLLTYILFLSDSLYIKKN